MTRDFAKLVREAFQDRCGIDVFYETPCVVSVSYLGADGPTLAELSALNTAAGVPLTLSELEIDGDEDQDCPCCYNPTTTFYLFSEKPIFGAET